MTYFGFLFLFLGLPLLLLAGLTLRDARRRISLPPDLRFWSPGLAVLALIIIAVVYTTPWDNYLVANRVWWYDPALVTGLVLGWVPLEEYTFFVLQTLFTGLWLLFLARRLEPSPAPAANEPHLRWKFVIPVALLWLASVGMLGASWRPGTYLALELSWALLPVLLQLAFGADILWRWRRLAAWSILPTTLYLSAADALAIGSGTWTINPDLSLGIYLGGILPLEELLFFALTNILVTFGLILALSRQSQARLPILFRRQPRIIESVDV